MTSSKRRWMNSWATNLELNPWMDVYATRSSLLAGDSTASSMGPKVLHLRPRTAGALVAEAASGWADLIERSA